MAKYLDNNGLAYFWQKVKAYVDAHGGSGGASSISEYSQVVTTTAQTSSITITYDGYNANTDVLQVYVNGLKAIKSVDYSVSGTTITLTNSLPAGNVIEIIILKVS